ncbi:MAG TPA: hypothetical protein VMH27_09685 [Puia sp.]|nr:hypothetical protein [Puia sp.]
MTLVVQTRNRSTPTILGDLLVTSDSPGPSIILPAVGLDTTGVPGIPRIVSLIQKVYILADNICISFTSNDITEVRNLLEDFRPFCSAGLPPEHIRKWVEVYDYSGFPNSSFLMTIVDNKVAGTSTTPNVIALVKGHGFVSQQGNSFMDYRPAGSGTADFASMVDEKRKIFTSFPDSDYRQGVVRNMAFAARFLAEERYFLRTLQASWGGGFELAFYNGQRFQKLDNFAIVLQKGKFTDQGDVNVELPITINHYRYHDDDLVITAIEMLDASPRTEGDFTVWTSNSIRVGAVTVPQITRGIRQFGSAWYPTESFETCQIGMGFAIEFQSRWFKPAFYNGNRMASLVYSHAGRRAHLRIHRSIQRFVLDIFRSAL